MTTSVSLIISTYYPLCLTCVTTILNSLTIFVLYQDVFRQRPAVRYMRAMAIVDMLMLYGWNLDHFFRLKFGFEVDRLTVATCKILIYLNHLLSHSSAWLRVWMCIDRFLTLNQVRQRRAIYQHRRVIFLIIFTFIALALINLPIPIFSCYSYVLKNETKIASGSPYFPLYPAWNYINLMLYNILPFTLMLIFTILIIRYLILIKRTSSLQQSRIRYSTISIPILLSAILFCLMTTPPALIYAFFRLSINNTMNVLDSIKYTYHSLSFLIYFVTLVDFRQEVYRFLHCQYCKSRLLITVFSKQRANRYKTQATALATITK